jgi:hypothetical protein
VEVAGRRPLIGVPEPALHLDWVGRLDDERPERMAQVVESQRVKLGPIANPPLCGGFSKRTTGIEPATLSLGS